VKNYTLGVMQGRLLPKYKGRYQAHPVGYWQQEFAIASQLKLDCIEFILDLEDRHLNPLMSVQGVTEIRAEIESSKVAVKSICADCFMDAKFHSDNDNEAKLAESLLEHLISIAPDLGVSNIVIPCVDRSSLTSESAAEKFVRGLSRPLELAAKNKVYLALETDLAPSPFHKLLSQFQNPWVSVNYDVGNSAALGYPFEEEFELYGTRMTDVHIKDRVLGGSSVILGKGAAKIDAVLSQIGKSKGHKHFVMQAFRDDEGLAVFTQQLTWVREKFDKYFS
jgi:L-ribulose-5-phosphate 3-epimerase